MDLVSQTVFPVVNLVYNVPLFTIITPQYMTLLHCLFRFVIACCTISPCMLAYYFICLSVVVIKIYLLFLGIEIAGY